VTILNLISRSERIDKVPSVFGVGMARVMSDSMEGTKPAYASENKKAPKSFNVGDAIFIKSLDENKRLNYDYKVGDVVCFFGYINIIINGKPSDEYVLITHRIVYIEDDNLVLQGDKIYSDPSLSENIYNPEWGLNTNGLTHPFPTALTTYDVVKLTQIVGVYNGFRLANAGNPGGFFLIVVLPTILLLLAQGVFLVLSIIKLKNEKDKISQEDKEKVMEEEREKIRQELLEEMKKEKKE